MKPGDLVHVVAENAYHGIGVVIEVESISDLIVYRVLMSDGARYQFFPGELEVIDETG